MDSAVPLLTVEELVRATDAHFTELNYADGTLKRFRYTWKKIVDFTKENNIVYLTSEACREFMDKVYGFELYTIGLSNSKSMVRRPVLALLEFQQYGYVLKRHRNGIEDFHEKYAAIINAYFDYLTTKNLAEVTIKNIRYALLCFTKYLAKKNIYDIKEITIQIVNEYALTLVGYSKQYIYGILSKIKHLLKFAYENGYMKNNLTYCFPIINLPSRLNIPAAYTEEEVSRLLASVDTSGPVGKRDYAMLLLSIRYGLRVADIRDLKISSLSFEESKISIVEQKNGKLLTFDMLPEVGWALIDYLKNGRPNTPNGYVFLMHRAPYDKFGKLNHLWQIINKYMKIANIPKVNGKQSGFHAMRHSLASNLLNQSVPLTVIKEVLGHENLYTTTVYTKVDVPQLSLCALEVPL